MKDFIVYQVLVVVEEIIGNINTINLETVVRRVVADSQEQAIGMFILNTKDIKAVRRLDVDCILLDSLKTIQ